MQPKNQKVLEKTQAGRVGRPTKFKKRYCREVIEKMAEGEFDCNICADWEISADTFYRWRRENPEFKEAHKIGIAKCESWWIKNGLADNVNFKFWIALMKKKFNYAGTQGKQDGNKTVNIDNMNILALSEAEMNGKLAHLMDKYGAENLQDLKQITVENGS